MTVRFEACQWVPFPVELVFAFFANPANVPRLMPPRLEARIEDARVQPPPPRPVAPDPERRFRSVAAGQGSEILLSFYPIPWVPRRLSWMTRISEFVWNSHFCEEQARGPFSRFLHRHGIQAETRDGIEERCSPMRSSIPALWLLRPSGRHVGAPRTGPVFAYRQKRLPEILAIAARQAAKRA